MSLLKIEPFIIDSTANFVFNGLTVTANLTTGNANLGNLATSNYFSGSGNLLSNIQGSNVTGAVGLATYATTANSVAVANVSGIGNVATLNKDGNASNILYGNGVFAAPAAVSSYGNSNVATFLASYGSNTITTTGNVSVGNIIGNGQALTGLAGANVTGAVSYATTANSVAVANVSGIGNIATVNKDGNSSNILYGNGVFASAPVTYGNSNVVTFLGSYGSNTITTTGNITAGNLIGVLANGNSNVNIPSANGNVNISAVGNANVVVITGTGANVNGYANISGALTASSIVTSGSAGNITGANYIVANYFTGTLTTAAQPNITSTGTLTGLTVTGNTALSGANVSLGAVGNLHITGGSASQYLKTDGAGNLSWADAGNATALINGNSNVVISANSNVTVSVAGNSSIVTVTGTGVNVSGYLTASGNITAGNITTSGSGGNLSGANYIIANYFSGSGNNLSNIQGANVSGFVPNANVANTAYAVAGANVSGAVAYATTANSVAGANVSGAVAYATTANAVAGANVSGFVANANVANTAYAVSGSNVSGAVAYATTANSVAGANVSGFVANANVANTAYAVSGSNVSGQVGNALIAGTVYTAAQPNITSVGTLTSLNVSGNANAGNIGANNAVFTGTGSFSGNVNINSQYINNVSNPVLNQDVATKSYVDGLVATGLFYHPTVTAATTDTLANITVGTITYNNGTSGVNANLVTTGSFNLIDTANVQTVGTRILVKNEANATWNGIYTWANATTIVRSTDTDSYGPGTGDLSLNDYFFVSGGSVNKGVAYVCTTTGTIVFGTTNIDFSLFSSSQVYSAGTGLTLNNLQFSVNASQTQITSVGTLGALAVTGNISSGNANLGNLTTSNYFSGSGNLLSNIQGANVSGAVSYATTANSVAGANVSGQVSFAATANAVAGANVSGFVANANVANTAYAVAGANVSGFVANANVANTAYAVAGANVSGFVANANVANTAYAVAGANVSGQVANALVAGTVYTAAQPNITSVGSLSGLVVSNSTGIVDFTTTANVTLGNVSNLHISGGTSGYVLKTDGTGNLSWVAQASAGGAVAGSNTQVQFNDSSSFGASANFAFDKTSNTLTVDRAIHSKGANLGTNVSNIYIGGGGVSQILATDGSGNLTWVAQPTATITVDNFTGDGTTTAYTLSTTPASINQTVVNYNGAFQLRTSAYTLSGPTLTFTEAPVSGSKIEVTTTMGSTSGAGAFVTRTYSGTGSQTTFTVTSGVTVSSVLVTENGLVQTPTTDYTISGTTLTFATAPANGVVIQIRELAIAIATTTSPAYRAYTGNGVQTTFTVTSGLTANSLIIAENGILQRPTTDYTVSGSTVTFATAPASGVDIQIRELSLNGGMSTGGISLPYQGGNSGKYLTTDGATASWANAATFTWNIVSSNTTMTVSNGYFVNTSGGPKTMTLPATAVLGDTIRINDLAGTFASNNLTVGRNGGNIQGSANDLTVSLNQSSFGLVYSNSTYGWKVMEL